MKSLAEALVEKCTAKSLRVATAESCTGGLVAAMITEVPSASAVFERGFVTYSNAAKEQMLGVPAALIASHGAVSAEVAEAMARGALKHSAADMAVSITGIAGPTGGTKEKPVGLVFIALATRDDVKVEKHHFSGNRTAIRAAAAERALELLSDAAG